MTRIAIIAIVLGILTACTDTTTLGADGKPLPVAYNISTSETARVQFAMLDGINSIRSANNLHPVALNAQLNAAAATHSRDMAVQNRPWHFGSDSSSPRDRVQRVGYTGELLGENISETFESELETLAAWMVDENTRRVILDKNAQEIGFSWFQEQNQKIWWTLVVGTPQQQPMPQL